MSPGVKNINENEHKNKNENRINSTLTCENLIFTSYKTYDTSRSRAECSSVPFSSYFFLSLLFLAVFRSSLFIFIAAVSVAFLF